MVTEEWAPEYESLHEQYNADFSKFVGRNIRAQFNYLMTPHEDKEGYFWDGGQDERKEKYFVYKMCDLFMSDEFKPKKRAALFLNIREARKSKHIDYLLWWARGVGEFSNDSVPWQILILSVFGNDSLDHDLVSIADWNWD